MIQYSNLLHEIIRALSTTVYLFIYLFVFNLTITVNQKIHFTQEIQRTCFYDHSISEQNIC